jgi:hypothetical protein
MIAVAGAAVLLSGPSARGCSGGDWSARTLTEKSSEGRHARLAIDDRGMAHAFVDLEDFRDHHIEQMTPKPDGSMRRRYLVSVATISDVDVAFDERGRAHFAYDHYTHLGGNMYVSGLTAGYVPREGDVETRSVESDSADGRYESVERYSSPAISVVGGHSRAVYFQYTRSTKPDVCRSELRDEGEKIFEVPDSRCPGSVALVHDSDTRASAVVTTTDGYRRPSHGRVYLLEEGPPGGPWTVIRLDEHATTSAQAYALDARDHAHIVYVTRDGELVYRHGLLHDLERSRPLPGLEVDGASITLDDDGRPHLLLTTRGEDDDTACALYARPGLFGTFSVETIGCHEVEGITPRSIQIAPDGTVHVLYRGYGPRIDEPLVWASR